jgi:hypothetical protein
VSDVAEFADPTEPTESEFLLGIMIHDGEPLGVIDVPRIFGSLRRPG